MMLPPSFCSWRREEEEAAAAAAVEEIRSAAL